MRTERAPARKQIRSTAQTILGNASLRGNLSELATLAVPIAGIQLAQIALTATDTFMMGSLGFEELAAGGLALVLWNQARTMCVGLIMGIGNKVAQAQGRNASHREIRTLVRAGFLVATLAGIIGVAALLVASFFLSEWGQQAAVVTLARPLLLVLAPGLIPLLLLQALRHFATGLRRPKSLLPVMLGAIGINVLLNVLFIYGLAGFPRWGLMGVGIATTCVQILSVAAYGCIVFRDPQLVPYLRGEGHPTRAAIRELVRLGVPTSLTYGCEAGLFSVAALMMGHLGTSALAAHNAVNMIVTLVFQLSIGLSHAGSVMVSHAVGQEKKIHARKIAILVLSVGAVLMAVIGLVYAIFPRWIVSPFGLSDDALHYAYSLLWIAVILQFFDTAQNIAVGLLRGVGAASRALTITLVGYWAVGVPVAWGLGFYCQLGARGVWWGLVAGLAFCAALMLRAFEKNTSTREEIAS